MTFRSWIQNAAVALAAVGMIVPAMPAQAANQGLTVKSVKTVEASVLDVALSADGALVGRVVDQTGTAKADVQVTVRQGQKEIATAKSDSTGTFSVANLKSGQYDVVAGQTVGHYRVWSESVAPQSAGEQALLVVSDNGVRGGSGTFGGYGTLFGNGNLLLAAGVLTAVIISAVTLSQVNDIPKSN